MRKWRLAIGLAMGFSALSVAGELDPGLEALLGRSRPEETVSTIVFLRQQVDIPALRRLLEEARASLPDRHWTVVTALRDMAERTQGLLRAHLADLLDSLLRCDSRVLELVVDPFLQP